MSRRSLPCEIGFADGELEYYIKNNSQLKVVLCAWNNTKIELIFSDVIFLKDNGIGAIADVCVETQETDVLASALILAYEQTTLTHPYKEYLFLNSDDSISLTVVAESVENRIIS